MDGRTESVSTATATTTTTTTTTTHNTTATVCWLARLAPAEAPEAGVVAVAACCLLKSAEQIFRRNWRRPPSRKTLSFLTPPICLLCVAQVAPLAVTTTGRPVAQHNTTQHNSGGLFSLAAADHLLPVLPLLHLRSLQPPPACSPRRTDLGAGLWRPLPPPPTTARLESWRHRVLHATNTHNNNGL